MRRSVRGFVFALAAAGLLSAGGPVAQEPTPCEEACYAAEGDCMDQCEEENEACEAGCDAATTACLEQCTDAAMTRSPADPG